MEKMAKESLVSENSLTNNAHSAGSIVSLLTGKLPTTTKVVYAPDTLKGVNAYQHLPGILKQLGYRTLDLSIRHYADAMDLNLRNGFDVGNFRQHAGQNVVLLQALRPFTGSLFATHWYFLERIYERISTRLRHIFLQSI